jgi:hypothetical protein
VASFLLIEANYIIEFKYRVERKWEYVYYFRKVPFTPEEKAEILDNARNEFAEIWGLDFQDLKLETGKSRDNQKNLLNKNTILNTNNQYIDNIDDDKRTSPSEEDSAVHNDEAIHLIISNLREATKEELSNRSYNAVVRRVVDKYNRGKISEGKFRDYLVAALTNKITELELRRQKDKAKEQLDQFTQKQIMDKLQNRKMIKNAPKYDWLNQE